MTRDEAFELLKWLILQLRDNEKELREKPQLFADWLAKRDHLDACVKKFSDAEQNLLDKQYKVWHEKEILPHVSKIDPRLLQTSS